MEYTKTLEDKKYILAKSLEKDGSFSKRKDIHFSCLSKEFVNNIYSIMEELGYSPKLTKDKASIYKINKVIKCSSDILPYISHKGRKDIIHNWLSNHLA